MVCQSVPTVFIFLLTEVQLSFQRAHLYTIAMWWHTLWQILLPARSPTSQEIWNINFPMATSGSRISASRKPMDALLASWVPAAQAKQPCLLFYAALKLLLRVKCLSTTLIFIHSVISSKVSSAWCLRMTC